MVEVESNFNLGMDEDGIEELLEVVPDELTMDEVLELEQKHIAEEEARKGKVRRRKEEPLREFTRKGLLVEGFCRPQQFL